MQWRICKFYLKECLSFASLCITDCFTLFCTLARADGTGGSRGRSFRSSTLEDTS